MRKLISVFIILSTGLLYLSAQSEKDIKAPVKNATVYPDRAQLVHEATVEIPSGNTLLKLTGLSPFIDARSVQVKGYGSFTILSVNHQNNYLENLEELPEIKTIRNQIETLQLKVEDEKASITVLKEKEAFLVANRGILVKETTFSVEQLKSVMDLYTNNMEQVTTTILKKNRLIRDYEKQIAALQQQISDRTGKNQLPSGEISVAVSADKTITGRLTISYVTMNAGWYPTYDIRVDDITKPVNIIYKANVYQNTGTTWKDVKLSFSNATPWVAGTIPVLSPWFIDFFIPQPVMRIRGAAEAKSSAPMVMEMAKAADEAVEEEAGFMVVEKKIGETTVSFDVSIPYTIESGGKYQTIELQRTSTPAEYRYVAVPKISPHAYLSGNITNWAEQSLQSGEATLYYENTFVGRSDLNVNQMTDTLVLSLGTDNSILVKREKRKEYTGRRVIGVNKTESFSFLLTVRNNKSSQISLRLKDQIPVSSNSGITVEAQELSGGRHNQQTGEINWDLEIKPQETKQIILSYSVKYPKDKTVILE